VVLSLRSQRRLAAEILKIGKNRVWIDSTKLENVEGAITRSDISSLIHEGVIKALPKIGISRYRARILHEKKKKGRRRDKGSRTGGKFSINSRKTMWMYRIRAQRRRLRELKLKRRITAGVYRKLYLMAKGGAFKSASHLMLHIDAHKLAKKR
jgi:large subunit ribosomal protein L19e